VVERIDKEGTKETWQTVVLDSTSHAHCSQIPLQGCEPKISAFSVISTTGLQYWALRQIKNFLHGKKIHTHS